MGSAALALPWFPINILSTVPEELTHKQLEMNGCVISTEATDVLMPKHQVISIHSADLIFIILPNIHSYKTITFTVNNTRNWNYILQENRPSCLRIKQAAIEHTYP